MLALFETIRIEDDREPELAPHLARLARGLKYFGREDINTDVILSEINVIPSEINVILSEAKDPHIATKGLPRPFGARNDKTVSSRGAVGDEAIHNTIYKLKITVPLEGSLEAGPGQIQGKYALYSLEPYGRFTDPNYIIKLKLLDPKRYHSNSKDPLVYHKTTHREDFSEELKHCDEVIWLNERGEIAEGSYTNIFWQDAAGLWHTPAIETGILAGTMRAKILSRHPEQKQRHPERSEGSPGFAQQYGDCFAPTGLATTIADPRNDAAIKQGFYYPEDLLAAKQILITNSMLGARHASF